MQVARAVSISNRYISCYGLHSLIIKQKANVARHVEFPSTTTTVTNIYISIGYSFALGDLVLHLKSNQSVVSVGRNVQDAHTLIAKNVPAGDYVIVLYEPVKPAESLTMCSHFGFMLSIAAANEGTDARAVPRVPSNLNSVPYLRFTNAMYLQGQFAVPQRNQLEEITWTVKYVCFVFATIVELIFLAFIASPVCRATSCRY